MRAPQALTIVRQVLPDSRSLPAEQLGALGMICFRRNGSAINAFGRFVPPKSAGTLYRNIPTYERLMDVAALAPDGNGAPAVAPTTRGTERNLPERWPPL